jgi:hypothetical protein
MCRPNPLLGSVLHIFRGPQSPGPRAEPATENRQQWLAESGAPSSPRRVRKPNHGRAHRFGAR